MYDRKNFVRPKMSWMCLFFVVSGGKQAWSAPFESPSEQLSSSGIQSGNAGGGGTSPTMERRLHDIIFARNGLLFFSTCSVRLCTITDMHNKKHS